MPKHKYTIEDLDAQIKNLRSRFEIAETRGCDWDHLEILKDVIFEKENEILERIVFYF